ncbi:TetR family transcriptional regulator [Streptacidiphilus sp. 4-A2]|nr:TetR family transcriptional regulator [Streptacidiphilus sp. 4-A2]
MPKLWNETIEAHRHAVRETTLDVTAALLAEHGPASVTMSRIAAAAGIGRATLYKYFPDVESVLAAWHLREAGNRLARLVEVRDREPDPGKRPAAVRAYALLVREQRMGALPVGTEGARRARQPLLDLLRELLAAAAGSGTVRADTAPEELAGYCLHALGAAAELPSAAAAERLVTVVLDGLRPASAPG